MGVNQHVTPDIANMASLKPYTGTDQLHVGDDKGLAISHIAHSKIHAPKRTFTLSNILHVPHIKKPLLPPNVFFEFHPFVFYVKDLITKEVFLSGHIRDGLYIMSKSSATSLPQAFLTARRSTYTDV
jgi:hypothetical protein